MSARLRVVRRPAPTRTRTRTRVTVAQFRALVRAMRELPPDDWRDEIPAHALPPLPLIPADPNCIPF